MSTQMKVKEFKSVIHTPAKLKQIIVNGVESPQGLPPRSSREVYPVDSYPACPDSWMNGSDIAGSYFVGVDEEVGMWLDFNPCHDLEYEVAVVISIQGVNPITGQKTDALRLEQYKGKCPVHDVDFQSDNYCPKCEFNWPDQNYLATTGTPRGNFWLDGFRRPDGTVRQYIFTAEEMKGIASQVIGKDKVYAIGVAFYYSKEKKEPVFYRSSTRCPLLNYDNYLPEIDNMVYGGGSTLIKNSLSLDNGLDNIDLDSCEINFSYMAGGHSGSPASDSGMASVTSCCDFGNNGSHLTKRKGGMSRGIIATASAKGTKGQVANSVTRASARKVETVKPVKKLEVGAGALIKQKVYRDTKDIGFWNEEPDGMLYINYCDMETLGKILKAGEVGKKSEGFMDGLTVGS